LVVSRETFSGMNLACIKSELKERANMKTLSQLRALAASTVGATVSPFSEVIAESSWSKTFWVAIFLFPPQYMRNAFSFARSAGRCRVSRSSGGYWNVCTELVAPAIPVWPARLVPESRRIRLTRVEESWRFAEEIARPARFESQSHAQERYREFRKGYSSGLRPAGFPA
jgi:hypothetical protein